MRGGPTEGWILAGTHGGAPTRPALDQQVCGMPWALRLACDLRNAGIMRVVIVWNDGTPPAIDDYARDARLRGATLSIATEPPPGDDADPIAIVRADRVFHRDSPKQVIAAWTSSDADAAKLEDAVFVTTRARARSAAAGDFTLGGATLAEAEPPYLGFVTTAPDARSLSRAQRQLVWSLRKKADGLASSMINRHLSLPVSWLLMRTPIHPNHVTVFCFALAVCGGIVLGQGGYVAGVIGMLLVNIGSILDGVDGELARLKYRFSRVGQWMDTLADDFGNVAYVSGLAINLHAAGVSWAAPVAITALSCFALTQSTQYFLITVVYKSGDLAAIPWAFQSHDFLTTQAQTLWQWIKTTLPKTLKRDFALTLFVVLALLGRLDVILVIFSAGAISFFVVFAIQFVRNYGSWRT
jgi:phosphatidylglycerophosphate synthase